MVEIAAQISLTPAAAALDPAAILGADSVDIQAFEKLLAGQVQANTETGAPTSPLPPLPLPAGNRQPTGKILPGAAQILPDAATIGVQAVQAQQTQSELAAESAPVEPAAASPVHGLLKLLAAALNGPAVEEKPAGETSAEAGETEAPAASSDTSDPSGTTQDPHLDATLIVALPVASASLQQPPKVARGGAGDVAPAAPAPSAATTPAVTAATTPAVTAATTPAVTASAAMAIAQIAGQTTDAVAQSPVQSQPEPSRLGQAAPAEARSVPVLTVAAGRAEAAVPVVSLEAAATLPVGQTVTARIALAPAQPNPDGGEPLPADHAAARPAARANRAIPADAPALAERAASAARAAMTDRAALTEAAAPEQATSPVPPLAADSRVSAASPALSSGSAAPTVAMPRQDFGALVDRLIEARNAGAAHSSLASVRHAEFGQVSLQFQHDGKDLSVSMTSADPDFAVAVQAAMPAERQNLGADAGSRNQSQNQSQASGNSGSSQHDAGQRGAEAGEQQGRNGRNPRGGSATNPSLRWADNGQPQNRNGIFA